MIEPRGGVMVLVVIGVMLGLYILTQMVSVLLHAQERGEQPIILLLAGCTAFAALAGVLILLNAANIPAMR